MENEAKTFKCLPSFAGATISNAYIHILPNGCIGALRFEFADGTRLEVSSDVYPGGSAFLCLETSRTDAEG